MELPHLETLYQKLKGTGFQLVAIEALGLKAQAEKFIADNKLSFTFLQNDKNASNVVGDIYGVHVFPTSFLVDKNGRIVYGHVGFEPGDEAKLEKEIRSLME